MEHNYWIFGSSTKRGSNIGMVHSTQDAICPSQKGMIFKYNNANKYFNFDLSSSLYKDWHNYNYGKWKIATSDLVSLDCLKYY